MPIIPEITHTSSAYDLVGRINQAMHAHGTYPTGTDFSNATDGWFDCKTSAGQSQTGITATITGANSAGAYNLSTSPGPYTNISSLVNSWVESQSQPVSASTEYSVSVPYAMSTGTVDQEVSVSWYTAADVFISKSVLGRSNNYVSSQYNNFVCFGEDLTSPSNAAKVRTRFTTKSGNGTSSSYLPPPTLVPTTNPYPAGTYWMAWISANYTGSSSSVPTCGYSLRTDQQPPGGFHSGNNRWVVSDVTYPMSLGNSTTTVTGNSAGTHSHQMPWRTLNAMAYQNALKVRLDYGSAFFAVAPWTLVRVEP